MRDRGKARNTQNFQPGDILAFINNPEVNCASAKTGATAVVQKPAYAESRYGSVYVNVAWVRENALSNSQCNGNYDDRDFVLVQRLPKSTILVLREGKEITVNDKKYRVLSETPVDVIRIGEVE